MHRRVVVAGIGAALLAPLTWLALQEEPPPPPPPATADERRSAELLAAVREALDIAEGLPQGAALATVSDVHTRQAEALQNVIGRATVPPGPGTTLADSTPKDLEAAERRLVQRSRLMAVSTDDPDYAQLFAAVHASSAQLLTWLRDGRR